MVDGTGLENQRTRKGVGGSNPSSSAIIHHCPSATYSCNDTERLERRFLSRCRVLEFSSYGLNGAWAEFLCRVWEAEGGSLDAAPDFTRIMKNTCNNIRDALMHLEVELLAA